MQRWVCLVLRSCCDVFIEVKRHVQENMGFLVPLASQQCQQFPRKWCRKTNLDIANVLIHEPNRFRGIAFYAMFAKGLCFFQIQHNQAIGSVVRKRGLGAIGNVTQNQARDVGVTHRLRCGGPTAASTHVVTNTYCYVALILNIGKAGIWWLVATLSNFYVAVQQRWRLS